MTFDPSRTTPVGLSRYAREFFDVAMAADDVVGERPGYEIHAPVPVMYLVAHSIELSLKAFLVFKGMGLRELASKRYGHNLEKCFNKARELGLDSTVEFDEAEIKAMKVLNDLYCKKQLNYIVTGAKTVPVFGFIQSFTEHLIEAVSPYVEYNYIGSNT